MKIAFIVVAALMVALALAALLVPLVREGRRSGHTRGVFVLCLSIALLLPLGAGVLYLKVGTPAALNGVSAQAQTPISLPQAIAQLREHLAQQPDDQQGWMLLAQTSAMMRQPGDARDAWDHVLKLDANNAEAMVGWAESDSMLRADHRIDGRARELLQRAVKQHPDNQRGLWLLGISDFQRQQYADAARQWKTLLPLLQPGSKVAATVKRELAEAERASGNAPAAAGTAPAPTGDIALNITVKLAPRLADQLKPGDALFVFAKAVDGPPMPLAVAKLHPSRIPVQVTLTNAMAMAPGVDLAKYPKVEVAARISRSGNALPQPGDLESAPVEVATDSQAPIALTIDKVD